MAEYKKPYDRKARLREDYMKHPLMGLTYLGGVGEKIGKWNAKRLAKKKCISVNALAAGEETVQCTFLSHPAEKKSDGFILKFIGKEGMQVFTIDGGMSVGDMLRGLTALRADIMKKAGLEKEIENEQYKLDVNLLISHFHIDHVNELVTNVIPIRKYFRVLHIYYAADTVMTGDPAFDQMKNGDFTNRPRVMAALKTYHAETQYHEIPYGQTLDVKTNVGALKLFAPSTDWGEKKNAELIVETYYADKPNPLFDRSPVGIGNNNSTWMRASFAGKAMLFTGDVMKRKTDRFDEAVDHMIAYYGAENLRADIIKHPHHGQAREGCYLPIKEKLLTNDPAACVVLTGENGCNEAGPLLDSVNVPWVDLNGGDVTFALTREGIKRL